MLTFGTRHEPLAIGIELRRPLVYLDSCVISDIAGTPQGDECRDLVVANGDLYVSWAHLLELFSLGDRPLFDKLSKYLSAFGRHFVLIDSDIRKVSDREAKWIPGNQNPAIDEEYIKRIPSLWDGMSEMSLAIVFDGMRKEPGIFESVKQIHNDHKNHQKVFFDDQRALYRTDKKMKAQLDAGDYSRVPKHCLATRMQLEFLRELVRTNDQFNPSDALDLSHAVISVAYCDFTVLDKKWARRCRNLKLPRKAAMIFDTTQIDEFLEALRNFKMNIKSVGQ